MRAVSDHPAPAYAPTHADVTHIILVCLVVGLLSFVVIGWVVRFQFQWSVLLSRTVVILIALSALALVGMGSVRWGARVLIWGLWGANLEIASQNGGLHAPQILAFPVELALSGWLLGRRETGLMAVLTGLGLLTLLGLEQAGQLPAPRTRHPFVLGLLILGNLTIATAAALLSRASYLRQCAHLQQTLDRVLMQDAEQLKLLRLLDQCPVGLAITDAHHRLEYLNEALALSRGVVRADWLGRDLDTLNHLGLTPSQRSELAQARLRGRPWHGEQTLDRPLGQRRSETLDVVPLHDDQGQVRHWFELSQDTTDRHWAAEQIARLAYLDPATQLPNRAALLDQLESPDEASQGGQALLLFRLCGLRTLHDALGPPACEQRLREVADALRQHLPASARAYRLGGGTFAVRLWQLPLQPDEALSEAQREIACWQAWLQGPPPGSAHAPEHGVQALHLGATLYPWRGETSDSAQACLQRASLALSQARSEQSPQVRWCAPQQIMAAQQRLRAETDWRVAAQHGQLRLFLQGQYNPQALRVGLCADLRWAHPVMGLLPLERLPAAAAARAHGPGGSPLDDWALEQVAQWLQQHPSVATDLKVTLPWQAPWLEQRDAAQHLLQGLQRHGLTPHQLRLAIPTHQLSAQQLSDPSLLSPLHTLRHAGFELYLQDLGLGMPPPWWLQGWPVQGVHLSPDLLRALPGSRPHTELLSVLLSVCQSQGLRVVAQGVDNEALHQLLQGLSPPLVLQGDRLSPARLASDWPADARAPSALQPPQRP